MKRISLFCVAALMVAAAVSTQNDSHRHHNGDLASIGREVGGDRISI
jgi:hypothetical protein